MKRPIVLVIGGHDPSGGAGITADVETITALGGRATSVITALTVQDTRGVQSFEPTSLSLLISQARAIFEDLPIACIKTGMLATREQVEAVHTLLVDTGLPLICDPILSGGRGDALSTSDLSDAMRELLIPRARLLTPNSVELRKLAPEGDSTPACARELLELGAEAILVSGGHEPGEHILSTLYTQAGPERTWSQPRLPGEFHGTGCTLASACACALAQGHSLESAIDTALQFTWNALVHGEHPGRGQGLPTRAP
ncbi:MAG: bifunctional hydroxymethylpyrimidine kinase/phosphomethylpyrimidine kinase [Gammaproteobacteria bacterium]|jgi:hydroxymethylpyrimidine/phosphomethylpyrimidine kinase